VTRVVRNEPKTKGADELRLVMFTYDSEWVPECKALMEERLQQKIAKQRKAIMLLRYDAFAAKWEPVTADVANADEPFTTSNVSKALPQ
jgi:hypothetical protein